MLYMRRFATIWYHLYNLKNVKNTHKGALILVKPASLLKVTLFHGCSSRILNCTNDNKSRKASHFYGALELYSFSRLALGLSSEPT